MHTLTLSLLNLMSEDAREGLELLRALYRRVKTWHVEWLVVGCLLLSVAWATKGLDWGVAVWLVSTLLTHGVRSISSRQRERYALAGLTSTLEAHEVHCWVWLSRYSVTLSVLGAAVAVYRQEWHGLTALLVAVAYPYYRKAWRHFYPSEEFCWSRESD